MLINELLTPRYPLTESEKEHWDTLKKTGFWGKQAAGCVFVAKDTGRFCISHRSEEVLEPGTWGTWGGAVDQGENPQEAVRREIKEETGYTGELDLIPLLVFKAPSDSFQYYNFLAVVDNEFNPIMNWENQDFKWVEWGKWPSPLHPGLLTLLSDSDSVAKMKQFSHPTLAENRNNINVMYHVSSIKNRKSIARTGLEPRTQEFTNIKRKPGIYFLQSIEQAKDWAFWNAFDQAVAMDIWEVHLPKNYKLMKDPSTEMTEVYDSWVGYEQLMPTRIQLKGTIKVPKTSMDTPVFKQRN